MIVLQSVNHDNSQRYQEQIAIRDTSIARVMGPNVIQDVAILVTEPRAGVFEAATPDTPWIQILTVQPLPQ